MMFGQCEWDGEGEGGRGPGWMPRLLAVFWQVDITR